MKLIIQIPCFNEERTLPLVLSSIPREISGIEEIKVMVIDDGSTDKTIETAKRHEVDYILINGSNKGLAYTFFAGLNASLILGADILVNTDADNQYCAEDIKTIIRPIQDGDADYVIGDRGVKNIKHFSLVKIFLHRLGIYVVNKCAGLRISDVTSGFRALNSKTIISLNRHSDYTYTLETLIQASSKDLRCVSVPVRVNEKRRPSRLIKNNFDYVVKSIKTIFSLVVIYRILPYLLRMAFVIGGVGILLLARFLYFYLLYPGISAHIQSVTVGTGLLLAAVLLMLFNIGFKLEITNRALLENILDRLKIKREFSLIGGNLLVRNADSEYELFDGPSDKNLP